MHWGHFADGGYWQIQGTGLLWETSLLEATRKLKLGTPAQLSHGSSVPTLAIIGTCLCVHHNYSHQLGLAFSALHLSSSLFLWSQLWHSYPLSHSSPTWCVLAVYSFPVSVPTNSSRTIFPVFPIQFPETERKGGREGREGSGGRGERERRVSLAWLHKHIVSVWIELWRPIHLVINEPDCDWQSSSQLC